VILSISKFIAEYCRQYEASPHPFLRLGMDKKCLVTFNVQLTDGLPPPITSGGTSAANDGLTSTSAALINPDTATDNPSSSIDDDHDHPHNYSTIPIGTSLSLNLSKQEAHLYHYYRWLWIQFPWLAMPCLSDEVHEIFSTTAASSSSSSTRTHQHEITKATQSQEKIKVAMNKDGVIIQRSQSARLANQGNGNNATSGGGTGGVGTGIGKEPNESLSTLLPPSIDSNLPPEEIRRREIASRSWQAKKQDPSVGRVVSASQSRTNALIRSRYYPPLPPPPPPSTSSDFFLQTHSNFKLGCH
jgi:hypothetical protein